MATLHIISHTHWDREWHSPYSTFRAHLLNLVLYTLDLLERGELSHFLLDGQMVILDDLLPLRPDLLPRIQALNAAGKLSLGPWYVLADQFSVSGESLVRNLLEGRRVAEALGLQLMPLGYAPDTFGHSGDLPRILAGFGHTAAQVWRGTPFEHAIFRWQSPDGSEVLTLNQTYYQVEVLWDEAGRAERLAEHIAKYGPRYPLPHYLLLNGGDHLAPRPRLTQFLATLDFPHELRESSYADYLAILDRELDPAALPLLSGELRLQEQHPWIYTLPGTWSARLHLKAANAQTQHALRQAETWLGLIPDSEKPAHLPALLRHGWRTLLQNHPHDTICGCSTTEVTQESEIRFKQAAQTAAYVMTAAQEHLLGITRPQPPAQEKTYIVVWNPQGQALSQAIELDLTLAAGAYPQSLRGPDGEAVPFAWEPGESGEGFQWDIHHLGIWHPGEVRGRIAFPALNLPPCGYAVFTLDLGPEARPSLEWYGGDIPDYISFWDEGDQGDTYNFSPSSEPIRLENPRPGYYQHPEGGLEVEIQARAWPGLPLQCDLKIHNQRENHRLRLHLWSKDAPFGACTDTHYGMAERTFRQGPEPRLDPQTSPNQEVPTFTHPMQSLALVDGYVGAIGLAALGLPEVEFIESQAGNGSSTIALTLLRCVGWLSRRDLLTRTGGAGPGIATPDAQMIGRWQARIYVLDFSPKPDYAPAAWWQAGQAAAYPCAAQQVNTPPAQNQHSYLAITNPNLALVALKPGEKGGRVLRILNLSGEAQALPDFGRPAQLLRLDETPIPASDTIGPYALVTLSLEAE